MRSTGLARRFLTTGYLLATRPPGNPLDPRLSGSRRLLHLLPHGSLTDEVRVGTLGRNCQPRFGFFRATVPAQRSPVTDVGKSRGEEHRQDGGVGVADRIDADPADHGGDGPVGFGFHPGGAVLEAQVR